MPQTTQQPWLSRYAAFTAAATLFLICVGGLVTSHGVGMAVPDWPNTYGYNMFFFPVSKWMGGIFYEHTHRLVATGVGLLTAVLALWVWGRKARPLLRWASLVLFCAAFLPRVRQQDAWVLLGVGVIGFIVSFFWPRGEPCSPLMRWLGVIAFLGVVLQGVVGGLRVRWTLDYLGIPHATMAQLFFILIGAMALMLSPRWEKLSQLSIYGQTGLRYLFLLTTAMILGQLILGATMRHQHAGLAIPDFPAAYGKLWPAMDSESVAKYNQTRLEVQAYNSITAFQIGLQMAHRIVALLILILVAASAWLAQQRLGAKHALTRLSFVWIGLIAAQIGLGAAMIWTNKSADIATAHVAVGALSLMIGAMMTLMAFRASLGAPKSSAATEASVVGAVQPTGMAPRSAGSTL